MACGKSAMVAALAAARAAVTTTELQAAAGAAAIAACTGGKRLGSVQCAGPAILCKAYERTLENMRVCIMGDAAVYFKPWNKAEAGAVVQKNTTCKLWVMVWMSYMRSLHCSRGEVEDGRAAGTCVLYFTLSVTGPKCVMGRSPFFL